MQITLEAVSKSFGPVQALDAVSLAVEPGQIVVLLGPNGAGKTTLMRCLATIAAPDSGEILCDGERLGRARIDLRRRLFFMPDFPYFHAEMTLIRHIGMVLDLYEVEQASRENAVIELMEEFDVLTLAGCRMGTLSRGQCYKGALVALMAVDPELWIFDEPFASGMDPRGLSAFQKRCRDAVKRGHTIIYSTQIIDVVEQFADRVCVLIKGVLSNYPSLAALRSEIAQPHSPLAGILGDTEGAET